jgi:mono/diheme cytochrome c family protein
MRPSGLVASIGLGGTLANVALGGALVAIALVSSLSDVHGQGAPDASFTPAQREGLRLFSQSYGVCHTQVQQRSRQYGPVLSQDTLGGDEELIAEYIRNGTPLMPGFRYYFEPSQIGAIVAYIKTVAPQTPPGGGR